MMTSSDIWTAARAGQWASWRGLPIGQPAAAAIAALGETVMPLAFEGRLGRHRVEVYDTAQLRVWADAGGTLLVEWRDPPCAQPLSALLAELGAPDREAAGRYLRSGATTTEYVYAQRGLALTAAASYDQPPRFTPYLATVQLFAPTSLRDFILELGGNDQPGPRPIGPALR